MLAGRRSRSPLIPNRPDSMLEIIGRSAPSRSASTGADMPATSRSLRSSAPNRRWRTVGRAQAGPRALPPARTFATPPRCTAARSQAGRRRPHGDGTARQVRDVDPLLRDSGSSRGGGAIMPSSSPTRSAEFLSAPTQAGARTSFRRRIRGDGRWRRRRWRRRVKRPGRDPGPRGRRRWRRLGFQQPPGMG